MHLNFSIPDHLIWRRGEGRNLRLQYNKTYFRLDYPNDVCRADSSGKPSIFTVGVGTCYKRGAKLRVTVEPRRVRSDGTYDVMETRRMMDLRRGRGRGPGADTTADSSARTDSRGGGGGGGDDSTSPVHSSQSI